MTEDALLAHGQDHLEDADVVVECLGRTRRAFAWSRQPLKRVAHVHGPVTLPEDIQSSRREDGHATAPDARLDVRAGRAVSCHLFDELHERLHARVARHRHRVAELWRADAHRTSAVRVEARGERLE